MTPPTVQDLPEISRQAHDAGFDAFMTGSVLLQLATRLGLEPQGGSCG